MTASYGQVSGRRLARSISSACPDRGRSRDRVRAALQNAIQFPRQGSPSFRTTALKESAFDLQSPCILAATGRCRPPHWYHEFAAAALTGELRRSARRAGDDRRTAKAAYCRWPARAKRRWYSTVVHPRLVFWRCAPLLGASCRCTQTLQRRPSDLRRFEARRSRSGRSKSRRLAHKPVMLGPPAPANRSCAAAASLLPRSRTMKHWKPRRSIR
jgi:hypothetical protein